MWKNVKEKALKHYQTQRGLSFISEGRKKEQTDLKVNSISCDRLESIGIANERTTHILNVKRGEFLRKTKIK